MKNKWVKRIATAVATLAVAAGVFAGATRGVNAADSGNVGGFIEWEEVPGDASSVNGQELENATLTLNDNIGYRDASMTVHVGFEEANPGEIHVYAFISPLEDTEPGNVQSASYSFNYNGHTYSGTINNLNEYVSISSSTVEYWDGEDLIDIVTDDDDDDDDDDTDDDTTPSGGNDSKPSDPAAGSSSSTHKHHTHNWVWTAIVNATENQDGTYAMKCTRCNRVDESTITVIAKESVTSDKNLQILGSVKPGETIKLDTKGTAAFNQYFIAELMKHSDSPVVADFEYKNKKWTLTAPAGFNWTANLDANGWAGFMSVAQNNAEVTVTER